MTRPGRLVSEPLVAGEGGMRCFLCGYRIEPGMKFVRFIGGMGYPLHLENECPVVDSGA